MSALLCLLLCFPADPPSPPVFTQEPPQELQHMARRDVVLVCEATGRPLPTVSWLINGKPLGPALDSDIIFSLIQEWTGLENKKILRFAVHILQVVIVQCLAKNSAGEVISSTIVSSMGEANRENGMVMEGEGAFAELSEGV